MVPPGKSKTCWQVLLGNNGSVPWNHSVCDFHLILRLRDFSKPYSDVLLGTTPDLLERCQLMGKPKKGLIGWALLVFKSELMSIGMITS